MPDFLTRLIEEKDQLEGRHTKLQSFIKGDKFDKLSMENQHLLLIQASAMHTYLVCLISRISTLTA